jgi:TonB family protein
VNDRWTPSLAFSIALILHVVVLIFVTRQYMASASKPHQLNQAAQRLTTVNGRPVRFVYVKDMVPSTQPPMDPTRLSDMNRRGASPSKEKGDSPDPTSFGQSLTRQSGGPGEGEVTRPSIPPSPASPPGREATPGSRNSQMAQMQRQQASRSETQARSQERRETRQRETNEESKVNGAAGKSPLSQGKPVEAARGLPVGGQDQSAVSSQSSAARPAQPRQPGIGTQLQNMVLGSIQGGYHNPNASRLNTGALSFDTAAWDLGPYARQVQERVQSNWHVPEAQMVLRQQGWVAIRFNVQKDGRVTDLQVIRPSGIPSYDQSALDALRSSNPLPPLPSQVTVPQIGGVFRFFYNMTGDEY